MFILTVVIFTIWTNGARGLEHNLLEEPGILAIESKKIFPRLGTHHMILGTNLNVTEDLLRLKSLANNFEKECYGASKKMHISICNFFVDEIKNIIKNSEMTINILNEFEEEEDPNRKRRWEGIIGLLKELFIGTNEADDENLAHRSAGASKHAIKEFKAFEDTLASRQNYLDKKLNDTREHVAEVANEIRTEEMKTKITLQIMVIREMTLSQIASITDKYATKNYINLIVQETSTLSKVIKTKYTNGVIPPLPIKQLIKLVSIKLYPNNSMITLMADVPIVDPIPLHQFFVIPAPDPDKMLIPDFAPKTITVDEQRYEYVESPTFENLIHINETLAISLHPILIRNTLSDISPCEIRSILFANQSCHMKKLEKDYDLWISTPVANMIAFISTIQKTVDCSGEKPHNLKDKAGFFTIKPNCVIRTKYHTISGPEDRTSYRYNFYKIEHVLPSVSTTPKYINSSSPTTTAAPLPTMPNDSKLEDVIDEFSSLEKDSNTVYIIIILALTMIIAIFFFIFFCRRVAPAPLANI